MLPNVTLVLDPPTLVYVTALVFAFSGGLMILARGPRQDMAPLLAWGTAMLLGSAGLVLFSGGMRHPFLSDGLGNAVFLTATSVSWLGSVLFTGLRVRWGLAAAGPLLWLLTIPFHDGGPAWLALACGIGALYTLANAQALWAGRAEHLASRTPALLLLVLHGIVFAARGLSVLTNGMPPEKPTAATILLLLESLLHTNGMAFLLLAMTKERVELRSNAALRRLSLQDGLTGIGNRRQFDAQLETEMRRAERTGTAVSLLLLDVDHFKIFNDAFGHPAGDECLRAIAGVLRGVTRREGDLAARYGGEEFAVLLPGTDLEAALRIAERLRAGVLALSIPHPYSPGIVTISIGVAAIVPQGVPDPGAALLTAADRMLYEAKRSGRNQVRMDAVG